MSGRPSGGVGSLFLVDANNFLFRAYHALPMLTAPDGRPVNAVHGYVRMVQAVRKEFAPQYLLSVFDASGGKNWRKDLYAEYKANRPPPPEDLRPQIPLVREATDALAIPWVEHPRYEADDLIAAYAEAGAKAGLEVVIVSTDKDLMQLVRGDDDARDGSVRLWDTMKNRRVGPVEVVDKFGVAPEKLGDLLALAGDSSDNVPGVAGIGPKTAASLLDEYGDLEGILASTDKIKQKKRRERLEEQADLARLSRELVALRTDYDLPKTLDSLVDKGPDRATMEAFFGPLGFQATLTGAVRSGSGSRRVAPQTLADTLTKLDSLKVDGAATVVIEGDQGEALDVFLAAARAAGGLGFELQLSGEDPLRADVIGVALAIPGGEAGSLAQPPIYLPLGHRSLSDGETKQWAQAELFAKLGPLLTDAALPKYTHALKNQEVVLLGPGLELSPRGVGIDTMLVSYTLDPARSDHELAGLAKDLGGHALADRESLVGKGKKRVGYDQVDVAMAAPWAGERAGLIATLGPHMAKAVEDAGELSERLYRDIELPLTTVLARLERRGILLDKDELGRQAEELGEQVDALRAAIEEEAGHPVDPNSPKQLGKLLFEERGLPAKKKTKTGYSTDAATLEELSLLDPIVKHILDYRSLAKLKGTYLDTLPTLVNPDTGRLHTHFHQAVAATGRLSSSDPNLQNIPIRTDQGRRIRRGFIAPEGKLLVTLDYSQIELRVLAHLSKDPNLCRSFVEGADVHRRTAAEVFEVSEDEVSDEQRRVAKAVNFGVIYGQSAFGLARQLGIPQGRAGRYIKAYFKKIPGVASYMTALIDTAKDTGFAETIFGRRRRIPELRRRGSVARSYGERIARNTPIQGSAADILKIAMVEVERLLQTKAWARMLLTVHDELIFECDAERVEALVKLVKPAMEGAAKLDVPLVVEGGWGPTWEAAKG
ncbi:DNA polymerase I [Pseudenhygromyxa sp. WMMC2535]|uniref:DNA polymerase I n=1 Tax=Pseudenhygromyxa sp. WMMC2535 TaxID=2712867 RepID=UPI001551B6AB|nr:DNA polymerase I [Pseudenhygromyxa sp. WMMC2535]NVB42024.1 DNA polymerase I [Pseudenhygromyxa sp. WMMC2535]